MHRIASSAFLITISLLGVVTSRCSSPDEDKRVPFGPEVKADLVIYFNTEVTDEQITKFWKETLSTSHPSGRGTYPRDGISEIVSVLTPFQKHKAVVVRFSPDVTQAQREEVKSRITSSLIVYKVLTDVAPADVKSLDAPAPTEVKH